MGSPAPWGAVEVGPVTYALPGPTRFSMGLQELKPWQGEHPHTTCCPPKWHRGPVEAPVVVWGELLWQLREMGRDGRKQLVTVTVMVLNLPWGAVGLGNHSDVEPLMRNFFQRPIVTWGQDTGVSLTGYCVLQGSH